MTDDIVDEQRLQELLALTKQLPRSIDPPSGAWGQIRSALEAEPSSSGPRTTAPFSNAIIGRADAVRSARFWQRPAFLAAAALLLVVGSSAITAVALRRGDSSRTGSPQAGVQPTAPRQAESQIAAAPTTSPATLAEFTEVEKDYIVTAKHLAELLAVQEDKLAPATVATLRESLRIIDSAILEARKALATDPANAALVEMLSGSYQKKLDLLRRTADMARS